MPSKRAFIAYVRFYAVILALVSATLYAAQHPMEAFLYAGAGLCAAAVIGLFALYLRAAEAADAERPKVSGEPQGKTE